MANEREYNRVLDVRDHPQRSVRAFGPDLTTYNEGVRPERSNESTNAKRPLRRGTPLPLRKGLERLNQKYAKTLEKLAK